MHIGDIMIEHVVTVGMDDSVRDVRDLFERYGFHHLVVIDAGKVVGIISDRDLLRHLSPFVGKPTERSQDSASLARKAHQIMTRQVVSIGPDASVEEGALLLLNRKISCLPVLDPHGVCLGIVTGHDVMQWCLQHRCCPPHTDTRAA